MRHLLSKSSIAAADGELTPFWTSRFMCVRNTSGRLLLGLWGCDFSNPTISRDFVGRAGANGD